MSPKHSSRFPHPFPKLRPTTIRRIVALTVFLCAVGLAAVESLTPRSGHTRVVISAKAGTHPGHRHVTGRDIYRAANGWPVTCEVADGDVGKQDYCYHVDWFGHCVRSSHWWQRGYCIDSRWARDGGADCTRSKGGKHCRWWGGVSRTACWRRRGGGSDLIGLPTHTAPRGRVTKISYFIEFHAFNQGKL